MRSLLAQSIVGLALLVLIACERHVPKAVVVACVGDSITEGWNGATPWPDFLAGALGEEFVVGNYGLNGATLQSTGDLPYSTSPQLQAALSSHPDIVIIMLGTNDGKAINWLSSETFVAEYRELLAQFQTLHSPPEIWLCTPPPVLGDGLFEIRADLVNTRIAPLIRIQIASAVDARVIDLASLMPTEGNYQEAIHPNSQGEAAIANIILNAVPAFAGAAESSR